MFLNTMARTTIDKRIIVHKLNDIAQRERKITFARVCVISERNSSEVILSWPNQLPRYGGARVNEFRWWTNFTPQTVMRVEFHPASNMAEHGKRRFYGMPIDNIELI